MDIAGKVFIVTGASSGLGQGTAKRLLDLGAKVVIADIQEAKEPVGNQDNTVFVKCDVTKTEDAEKAVEAACGLGTLFGLVNCAGIAPAQKIAGSKGPHDPDMFRKVLDINVFGTFNMTRIAAQKMLENVPEQTGERGVIINTASIAAFEGQVGQTAYSASKGAIVGMTLPIARDLSRSGIRCMTICPGIMGTPMMFGMPQDVQDSLAASIPFPSRLGRPADFAKLVESIVTNEMLNGSVIRLDGAIRMQPK